MRRKRIRTQGAAALDAALAEIEELATRPRIRVVGETGLDHYWVKDDAGRAAQEESFRRHIRLAKRLGAVLQIHDRDAHDDVLRVLEDEGAPERTVFHCFSGDAAMARHCADRGWYLSFAGTVTFKNAEPLREALRAVPLDLVLVETDAPYLAPVPYRGRTNAGYLVPHHRPRDGRGHRPGSGADLCPSGSDRQTFCTAPGRSEPPRTAR